MYRQSLDSNSRLRKGKVTRFTDKISLSDKITLPTPFKNSKPFEGDEDMFDTKMKLQRLEAELLKIMNSPTKRGKTSFPKITQNGVRKPPSPNPDHQEEHHQEEHQLQQLKDEVETIMKNRTAFSDEDQRQLQRLQELSNTPRRDLARVADS
jgi:small-conductance mechanosensitive channel